MKKTINAVAAIFVLLNASAYAFSDDNLRYDEPKRFHSIEDSSKHFYQRIETLDFSDQFPFLQWLLLDPVFVDATKADLKDAIDDMGLSNNISLNTIHVNGDIFGKVLSFSYLPNLTALHISSSALDIDFSRFPNLKEVHLRYCNFTDKTLKQLAQLSCLRELYFETFAGRGAEYFNDDVIEQFGRCQNLKVLQFVTKSPNAGYIRQRLKAVLPNTTIRVGWGRDLGQ